MSTEALAAFRQGVSGDLQKLAEEHLKHDLTESDRDTIKSAADKIKTHTYVGTLVGLGLGVALAWRFRQNRQRLFQTLRTVERPTHILFADGRKEALPDIAPMLQPSRLGDIASYTFFSLGGIFLGGECGLLSGAGAARRTITQDPVTKHRIEQAYLNYKEDVLKKQLKDLQSRRVGLDGEDAIAW